MTEKNREIIISPRFCIGLNPMCYDPGFIVAWQNGEPCSFSLEIRGKADVEYNNRHYTKPSQFPPEIKAFFRTNEDLQDPQEWSDIQIHKETHFEVCAWDTLTEDYLWSEPVELNCSGLDKLMDAVSEIFDAAKAALQNTVFASMDDQIPDKRPVHIRVFCQAYYDATIMTPSYMDDQDAFSYFLANPEKVETTALRKIDGTETMRFVKDIKN